MLIRLFFYSVESKSHRQTSNMVSQSKFKLIENSSCSTFIHPWSRKCTNGCLIMFLSGFRGAFNFFLAIYSVKLLLMGKQISYEHIISTFKALLLSTFYGAVTGTGFVAYNCFLRNVLGKFTYFTLGLVPGLLTGLGIFIENPSRRGVLIASLLQMATEVKLLQLKAIGYLNLTRQNATHMFMIFNSIIMLLFNVYPSITTGHWFYNPNKFNTGRKDHKLVLIMKDGAKMFVIGFILHFFRKILSCFTSSKNLSSYAASILQNKKSYTLSTFFASYTILYQAVNWLLEIKFGRYNLYTSLVAGYVAGVSSYYVQPNLSLLSSAISSVLLICCKILNEKRKIPIKFYGELIYIISSGIIYQARALQQETCPQLVKEVMDKLTTHRSEEMVNALNSAISRKVN